MMREGGGMEKEDRSTRGWGNVRREKITGRERKTGQIREEKMDEEERKTQGKHKSKENKKA